MARLKCNGGEVFHRNFMGAVAQLDADTVDGFHGAALLPSDRRLKSNVMNLSPNLDSSGVLDLIRSYSYNNDPLHNTHYGVIAQNLTLNHQLVPTVHEQADPDTGETRLAINPIDVLFYMVAALAQDNVRLRQQLNIS